MAFYSELIHFLSIITVAMCWCCHEPRVLMISMDGFRWDYLKNRTATPNFDFVKENGVYARKGIVNAFITKTFPNHYSIATGLYEESHGIVGNAMFDKHLNETFHIWNKSQVTASRWFDNGGEPIWVTNQRQDTAHRSGVYFWPGDAAPVKGFLPYRYLAFDPSVPNKTRVDKMMSWFTDRYPINLGLLYFEQPDAYGHEFGPESQQVTNMIGGLDKLLGYVLKQIKKSKLDINLIITSDHGMVSTPSSKSINLDDYIDPDTYRIFSSDPIASILPNNADLTEEIFRNLSKIEHTTVYKKADIPERYHYKHNIRIQPILLVSEEGYSLSHNGSKTIKGEHGYDNSLSSMHPFFLAMGPAFKKGASVESFNNVDIYPLICHIMNLTPAPNNGSLMRVESLLRDFEEDKNSVFFVFIGILIFVACVSGVYSIAACRQQIFHHRHRKVQLRSLNSMTTSFNFKSSAVNGGHVPLLVQSDTEDEF